MFQGFIHQILADIQSFILLFKLQTYLLMHKQLFLFLLLAVASLGDNEIKILSVSGSPDTVQNPVYSSLRGGRKIYINSVGHPLNPAKIQVLVGSYPCKLVDQGVSSNFVVCTTTDSGLASGSIELPVYLFSNKKSAVSSSPNVVIYTISYTPIVNQIFPASAYANQTISVEGSQQTNNVGKSELDVGDAQVKMGQQGCNRYNVSQPSISGYYSNEKLNCQQKEDKQAGKFNLSTKVPYGQSDQSESARKASLQEGEFFQFATLPAVTAVTPNGNMAGQEIQIIGSGFSSKPQNNTVVVDGNECEVTESTNNKIKCSLAKRNDSKTSQLTSNSTNQTEGYISGIGLKYVRYSSVFASDIFSFVSAVRNNPNAYSTVEKTVMTEIRSGDMYGSYTGQTWKGYFTAPVSGTYTFSGWAMYAFAFFLGEVHGSVEVRSTPFIYSNSPQAIWTNSFYDYMPTAVRSIELIEGQSYYIQAYHISYFYNGKFKISVEVPNNNIKLPFQSYHVDQIDITTIVQPEVVLYSMVGGSQGQINLKLVRTDSSGKIIYNKNTTVSYACSASSFASALYEFSSFYSYQHSVTRVMLDFDGNITTNISEATRIDYNVSFYMLRPKSYQQQKFIVTPIDYDGTFEQTPLIQHSPLINGSFSVNLGGVELNSGYLPYDISASSLQAMIRGIKGLEKAQVVQRTDLGYGYDGTWVILYKGYNGLISPLSINTASLTGGITSPAVNHTVLRNYSSSIVFEPIDYRFLATPAQKPNVLVNVNQIPAVCISNCSYSFLSLFEIVSMSISNFTLRVTVSNPSSINVTSKRIQVNLDGVECVASFTSNSTHIEIECQIQIDPEDGGPILFAGNFTPEVYIQQYGYVEPAPNVPQITIAFEVNSLKKTSGSYNGGYLNIIFGKGFKWMKVSPDGVKLKKRTKREANFTVTICNQSAVIKNVWNKRIIFYVPKCDAGGTYTVHVSDGTHYNTNLSFTYTGVIVPSIPTVNSFSPTSSNPKLKSILNIYGANFGSIAEDIMVFLSNSTHKIYQLRVLSVNSTLIRCGLPGGMPGNYTLEVNYPNGEGDAVMNGSNIFTYTFQIRSVSPSTGSFYGGTLITITGSNFLTGSGQTLVYIGNAINWFCQVQTLNQTTITCLTPPFHPTYTPTNPQKVQISSKLTSFSDCPNNSCSFTYMSASDCANLTSISETSVSGGTVIFLYGFNFTKIGGCQISLRNTLTNKITVIPALNCFPTTGNFTVPLDLPSGRYFISVKNQVGDSNPLYLNVTWNIGSGSNFGSTKGAYLALSGGSGYPTQISGNYKLSITSTYNTEPVQIISCCQNNILKLYIPLSPDGNQFIFKFQNDLVTRWANFTTSASPLYTPTFNVIFPTNLTLNSGFNVITLNRTSSSSVTTTNITLQSIVNSQEIILASWYDVGNLTNISVTLSPGAYRILVNSSIGYYSNDQIVQVKLNGNITASSQQASFAGGSFTLQGNNLSKSSYITVNGFRGDIIDYNSTSATYALPKLVTTTSQSRYSLAKVQKLDTSRLSFFSDSSSAVNTSTTSISTSITNNAFDNNIESYYQSSNQQCWVGVDMGPFLGLAVSRIKFFPSLNWRRVVDFLLYAKFQGSNDQLTWTTLAVIDQTVHSGWNTIVVGELAHFRYIRFLHNATSRCSLAQLQLFGIIYSNQTILLSTVTYKDGYNVFSIPNALNYSTQFTPVIEEVFPPFGDIFGGYTIKLKGNNLNNTSNLEILIDGVPCVYVNGNASELNCIVGARNYIPNYNTFTVSIGGKKAIVYQQFMYVLKWSDPTTWGTDLPPIDGDLVYVPAGMTLLVDQDTPQLEGIAVQNGTIIFANNTNITVKAGFITVVGGKFIAGTEQHQLTSNLTIELYGGYYGAQQPMAGNKGIFCYECNLSIFGRFRQPVWTTLNSTIYPGNASFVVSQMVDWQPGEQIVVASTSFNYQEAEKKTIVSVSGNIVFVDSPFEFRHNGEAERYGTDSIDMNAEVGLLTRNIKVKGDQTTKQSKYGAHLKMSGHPSNGFEAHVAYTEFTLCGQPQIPGRYCIYFHMNGQIPTSFVRGNSIHQSYSRAVSLHGVHLASVENNVAYLVRGHNFYLHDGSQTHNKIRFNLAISTLSASNMLYTDLAPASFMITNPSNDLVGNRAAGSDFYGIWYDLPDKVKGSTAQSDICPEGLPLGAVSHNVIHSSKYIGMRIRRLLPRLYPCRNIRNDAYSDDPWKDNPSIPSLLSNFTIYKNQLYGLLAEQTGNLLIENFRVTQSFRSGIEFYQGNFTKENLHIKNSVFVGKSTVNPDTSSRYSQKMSGLTTPRTGSTNLTSLRFYSFPTGSNALAICSRCDEASFFTNLGTQLFVSDLSFSLINGSAIQMLGLRRDVIYIADNSLSYAFNSSLQKGTIIYNYPHIAQAHLSVCFMASNSSLWGGTIMCDDSLIIRRVYFTNALSSYQSNGYTYYTSSGLYSYAMNFVPIINQSMNSTSYNNSMRTSISSMLSGSDPVIEKYMAWSLPFVAGSKYAAWFSSNTDFIHISIVTTTIFKETDPGIVFKFGYSENRQLFYVGPMRSFRIPMLSDYKPQSVNYLNPLTCQNGDYYHNNDQGSRMISVCQSGKNRAKFQYTEVNGIFCKYLCPKPVVTYNSSCNATTKESFIRLWSNASMWPNETVPVAGDNVTINCDWTVLINVSPQPMNYFIVDGDLVVDDSIDINITARVFHIRAGTLNVGSPSSPYTHNFTIQINGKKQDSIYYVDPLLAGNKLFIVTGSLALYGNKPGTSYTELTQTAPQNSNTVYVASSNGWKVGDYLALYPSFSKAEEYEEVQITGINGDGSINVTKLKYTHFGAASITISSAYGSLDARTRVAHLSRNIKFVSGQDLNWGYEIYVYKYYDNNKVRLGNLILDGVQMRNGGRSSSPNAMLQFINVIGSLTNNVVTGSSFIGCISKCLNIMNSQNISVQINVFFKSTGAAVAADGSNLKSIIIKSNLAGGVSLGYGVDGCFVLLESDPMKKLISVVGNICQGSKGYGFVLPHVRCNELSNHTLSNNLAGSCGAGFALTNIGLDCQGFSKIGAYASSIGQVAGPPSTTTVIYTNFVLADNQRGASMKFGGLKNSLNNTAFFNNSYITAISRPNCADCYGSNSTKCSQQIGLRMLSVSENGISTLSDGFNPELDIITAPQAGDAKIYIFNVIFDSFKQSYTSSPTSSIASNCKANFVFRANPQAVSATAGHYLFNTICQNCDSNSYILCDDNSQRYLAQIGGCGDRECTGKSNYLLQDWNGTFFGFKGVIIPNNRMIGDNQLQCVRSDIMNAHLCQREDFVILEYDSRAPDFNTRKIWPVSLTGNTSNYTTVTNGWREWSWSGSQPLGKRLGRFVSIVKLNTEYNMTFASMPPLDMRMQLQRRTPKGNNSNWVIVKIYYPLPNSIRVFVDDKRYSPIINTNVAALSENGLRRTINTSICGDNVYFYENRTIKIVITEAEHCIVKITVTDSIQLTTHFAMNASDFFRDTVMSNFIDNLCALLGIVDQSRVKIVGVHSGSAIIDTVIEAENGTQAAPADDPSMAEIAQILTQSIDNGTFSTLMQSNVGYTVLAASGQFFVLPDTTPTNTSSDDNSSNSMVMIGIAAGGAIILIVIFLVIYCVYKKRMAMKEAIIAQSSLEKERGEEGNEKEQSYNVISDSILFAESIGEESPPRVEQQQHPRQPRNRRVRKRQHLEIKQYD